MQRLLDGARHFSVEEIARRGWCVAAFPDAISEEQAKGIVAAAARRGIRSASAGTTESEEEQFELSVTSDGLLEFDANGLLRYYLLVTEQFAILLEANYYWLIAGPADFIEDAFGRSPAALLREFLSDYAEAEWPPTTAAVLREMERYVPLC
jgi:hypothetical protein